MPCFSSIATKLKNGEHIATALRNLGYTVEMRNGIIFGEKGNSSISFTQTGEFYMATGDTRDLRSISRQYAEVGVRAFARRAGYTVQEKEGNKITLVNRRG